MDTFLVNALTSYLRDHPSTPFQRGYLAALLDAAKEAKLTHLAVYREAMALLA